MPKEVQLLILKLVKCYKDSHSKGIMRTLKNRGHQKVRLKYKKQSPHETVPQLKLYQLVIDLEALEMAYIRMAYIRKEHNLASLINIFHNRANKLCLLL